MRRRRNILAAAVGVVAAVGFATYGGTRFASLGCAVGEYTEPGSDRDRFCASWFVGDGPVVAATAVAAAIAGIAVWLRRPELLAILAALGFAAAAVPPAKLDSASPDGPEPVEVSRDRLGMPITPAPDKPLAAPPPVLRTREKRLDEDAHMTSVNVLHEVGRCLASTPSPRSCERAEVWRSTGLATDAKVTVSVRDRDHYRVDAESAARPVVYSAIYDQRNRRIVYTCRPAPSQRCGEGRAEERLPDY